jgi:hypothetical protein
MQFPEASRSSNELPKKGQLKGRCPLKILLLIPTTDNLCWIFLSRSITAAIGPVNELSSMCNTFKFFKDFIPTGAPLK